MPFPQWQPGMKITASRLNDRNVKLVEQAADQTVINTITYVASGITFTPEPNAVYWYELMISYSANEATDIKWNWEAPGATFASFTMARKEDATGTFNAGAQVIFRRPTNTTDRIAGGGGSDSPPASFFSAYDRGTFATDGTTQPVTMMFSQRVAGTGETILRGGSTNTRMLYQRIA